MGTEIRTTSSTGGQKGTKEERHDLIPIAPLRELATHFGRGALKYDVHQWRQGYEWSKSYSALDRHLKLFWSGEDYDVCSNEPENCLFEHPEDGRPWPKPDTDTCWNHTGSHHMVAVAWHSFVMLEFKDRFPNFDDRYKTTSQARVEETGTNIKYIHLDDVAKAMQDEGVSHVSRLWLDDRFNKKPERLSWVYAPTGESQPVCVCSDEEREAQGRSLPEHYKEIHGIIL